MADSDAHTGMGAKLLKGDGNSPENFVEVLGMKSITPFDISRDTHDTTTMSSGQYREYIGGLVDAGEMSFEANFLPRDPTQNQTAGGLMAEFDRGSCNSRGNWRITLPECEGEANAYFEFAGIVTGYSPDMPMDDLMTVSGSIKISGRPSLIVEESA